MNIKKKLKNQLPKLNILSFHLALPKIILNHFVPIKKLNFKEKTLKIKEN